MKTLLQYAIVGGLAYYVYCAYAKKTTSGVNPTQYDTPIGPGLTGHTNVAKYVAIDKLNAPMGTFANTFYQWN